MAKQPLYLLQSRFAWTLARLIIFAESSGYHVTFGRVYESPEQNKISGGIEGSLHTLRLAADLNLFSASGKYLTKTEDYKPLGEWWEQQGVDYRWGGKFRGKNAGDAGHFSIAYNGRA